MNIYWDDKKMFFSNFQVSQKQVLFFEKIVQK